MKPYPLFLLALVTLLLTSSCGLRFKKLDKKEKVERDEAADLMEQGNMLFKQEQYSDALSKFLQARSIDPNRKLVNYNIGASYFALEKYPDAAKAFTDELKINNQDPFAYIFRAHSYAMMGLNDKAQTDVDISLQLTDHAMSYYVQGLILLNKGSYEMAVNKFNTAIYKEPADYLFYRDRGKAYAQQGNTEKACLDFKQAKRIHPKLDLEKELSNCE
jgi:tetratricopeptide (TPR) repeat protein